MLGFLLTLMHDLSTAPEGWSKHLITSWSLAVNVSEAMADRLWSESGIKSHPTRMLKNTFQPRRLFRANFHPTAWNTDMGVAFPASEWGVIVSAQLPWHYFNPSTYFGRVVRRMTQMHYDDENRNENGGRMVIFIFTQLWRSLPLSFARPFSVSSIINPTQYSRHLKGPDFVPRGAYYTH